MIWKVCHLERWRWVDKCLALMCSATFLNILSLQDEQLDRKECCCRALVVRVAWQPLRCLGTAPAASGPSLPFSLWNAHLFCTACSWSTLTIVDASQVQKHLAGSFFFFFFLLASLGGSLRPLLRNGVRRHRQKTEQCYLPSKLWFTVAGDSAGGRYFR